MAHSRKIISDNERSALLSIHQQLADGLTALQVTATTEQQSLLLEFISQLKKWNRTYNLVADASDEILLHRHLLDSISIAPYVNAHCILDVGSGGGFPGIPLAILKPESRFILLDSNGKKTRFLFQVKAALKLENVEVQNCRVEHYQSDTQIDIVTCRAFSTLRDILEKTAPLLSQGGHLLAMKGQLPEDEIDEIGQLGEQYEIANIIRLTTPDTANGSAAQRHLIDIIPR